MRLAVARRRLGAVAAAGDHQRAGAVMVVHAEMHGGEAAHRQADDVRLVDLQRIHHGADVVARAVLRVLVDRVGHLGRRIAARIVGDAAIEPAEMAHLRFPRADIAGKLVHEHDRDAGADLLVIELHSVVGGQMRHGCLR
jgi:hypothetical protein